MAKKRGIFIPYHFPIIAKIGNYSKIAWGVAGTDKKLKEFFTHCVLNTTFLRQSALSSIFSIIFEYFGNIIQ